jgi:hypothetical protein
MQKTITITMKEHEQGRLFTSGLHTEPELLHRVLSYVIRTDSEIRCASVCRVWRTYFANTRTREAEDEFALGLHRTMWESLTVVHLLADDERCLLIEDNGDTLFHVLYIPDSEAELKKISRSTQVVAAVDGTNAQDYVTFVLKVAASRARTRFIDRFFAVATNMSIEYRWWRDDDNEPGKRGLFSNRLTTRQSIELYETLRALKFPADGSPLLEKEPKCPIVPTDQVVRGGRRGGRVDAAEIRTGFHTSRSTDLIVSSVSTRRVSAGAAAFAMERESVRCA